MLEEQIPYVIEKRAGGLSILCQEALSKKYELEL